MDFTEECNEVEDIIAKLSTQMAEDKPNESPEIYENETNPQTEVIEYFKSKLPYNTKDADEIERQYNLLDFLIYNNLLNEENFKIFITEPEKHSEEASRILDELIVVVNNSEESIQNDELMLLNDIIPSTPPVNSSEITSDTFTVIPGLDKTILTQNEEPIHNESIIEKESKESDSNSCDGFFPIFNKNTKQIKTYSGPFMKNKQKISKNWKGLGLNQYQIDAGQKEFGAKECHECGLIYSVHEPEDEMIHLNFHNSTNLFKFSGWMKENVIAHIDEWGVDGRVLVVTFNDSKMKLKRIFDILSVADKELGYANIEYDKNCLFYIAVAEGTIKGICVVQSRSKAHRFIERENGDFCSEETYPVKCGILKIWVVPSCRRSGVAGRLIHAIRTHFVFGHILNFDEIAFSSPTFSGRNLFKKLTNRSDFLVF